ncbi:MAG: hypothetical protein ACD_79C01038G0001, partial [uncultured bacterium]
DGVNPYKCRSTETYFYNQGGKVLGEFIHPGIVNVTGLKDSGLKYGNLAVCRNTAVPSILLEIDYIIIPEAEERIQEKAFKERIAEEIAGGLEEYLKTEI